MALSYDEWCRLPRAVRARRGFEWTVPPEYLTNGPPDGWNPLSEIVWPTLNDRPLNCSWIAAVCFFWAVWFGLLLHALPKPSLQVVTYSFATAATCFAFAAAVASPRISFRWLQILGRENVVTLLPNGLIDRRDLAVLLLTSFNIRTCVHRTDLTTGTTWLWIELNDTTNSVRERVLHSANFFTVRPRCLWVYVPSEVPPALIASRLGLAATLTHCPIEGSSDMRVVDIWFERFESE